jgi:hypothetical protein
VRSCRGDGFHDIVEQRGWRVVVAAPELEQVTVNHARRTQGTVWIDRVGAESGQAPATVRAATIRAALASHVQQHRQQVDHRDV